MRYMICASYLAFGNLDTKCEASRGCLILLDLIPFKLDMSIAVFVLCIT